MADPVGVSPPPVEAYASLPQVESVVLSPSGRYLAFLKHEGDTTKLLAGLTKGEELNELIVNDNRDYRLRWIRWVGDDWLVAGAVFSYSRNRVETKETRLIAVRRDGKAITWDLIKARKLGSGNFGDLHVPQFQDNVLAIPPRDPGHIVMALDLRAATQPDVYRVNVATGDRELVQGHLEHIQHWMADEDGDVRAGWGVSTINQTVTRIVVKDPKTKEWRRFLEYDAVKDPTVLPMGVDRDPSILYLRAPHEGRAALYRVNLSDPTFPRELVAANPKYDVDGHLIYWLGRVVGVRYLGDTLHAIIWEEGARRLQSLMDRRLPRRLNVVTSASEDGRRLVILSRGATHPTAFYFLDRDANKLGLMAQTYPELRAKDLVPPEVIHFQTRDGLQLQGFLTRPRASGGKGLPTVLFPHGGPSLRDDASFNYWTQFFVSRGWAVLQVNFRGSEGFGEQFLRAGFQRWGLEMQDDLTDATQWVIRQGIADPYRICIVGASYGGYAALMGLAKTPDLYRCAVSFAGVTNLLQLLDDRRFYLGYQSRLVPQLGSWWGDRERLKQTSPVNLADSMKRPVLLAHGTEDQTVLVSHARDMVAALKEAKHPEVEYLEFEGGDHSLSRQSDRLRFFHAMEQFLRKHLDSVSAGRN